MKKKVMFVVMCVLTSAVLAGCGDSEAKRYAQATEIAAEVFATQTAEAPTQTPTLTPTAVPTATPRPAFTSTPKPTDAMALTPAPHGWREHAVSGFSIMLPERWEAVDVEEEGIDAIWDLLEGMNTEWAQSATAMLSAERMKEMVQFWAMDSEPAGVGYAIAIVMRQDIPLPMSAEDLCVQMPAAYEQLGVDLVDTECGLTINGLDAVRFMVRLPVGALAVKESQYVFVGEDTLWTLTFGVDETKWSEYEPTFVTAAESFRVTGAAP